MTTRRKSEVIRVKEDEIMTLAELAKYLRISEHTVLRMVRSGKIPGSKVSSQWRFRRALIDYWLTARMSPASAPEPGQMMEMPPTSSSSSAPELAVMDVLSGDKRAILSQLVRPLAASLAIADPDKFLDGLLQRESIVSTAVGGGIAVPHTREHDPTSIKRTCLVLGICRDGVDFDSLDGQPTYLFWLICTNALKAHLRLLARIMLMFRQPELVDQFRRSCSVQEIMDLLKEQKFEFTVRL